LRTTFKRTFPNLHGHVQFVLPPFGSVGSGLASYRDMTNVLRDEKEIKYSPTIGRQNNAKATNTPPPPI
jgi:hypothetical protein